jgi:hypothetical protein
VIAVGQLAKEVSVPVDARNRFEDDVFTWRATKQGKVFISYKGRIVTTLGGAKAESFLGKVNGLEWRDEQLLLARLTGQFKMGNER